MPRYPQAELNPTRIRFFFPRRTLMAKFLFALNGLVTDAGLRHGNWDKRVVAVHQHPTYQLMAAMQACDFHPEQSLEPLAQYYSARGLDPVGARARAEQRVLRYTTQYGALRDNLRRDGYRSDAASNQIGVAIGRDGTFIKTWEGHHRFALARLLGLSTVTLDVRWIHTIWHRHTTNQATSTPRTLEIAIEAALDQRL